MSEPPGCRLASPFGQAPVEEQTLDSSVVSTRVLCIEAEFDVLLLRHERVEPADAAPVLALDGNRRVTGRFAAMILDAIGFQPAGRLLVNDLGDAILVGHQSIAFPASTHVEDATGVAPSCRGRRVGSCVGWWATGYRGVDRSGVAPLHRWGDRPMWVT